MTIMFYITSKGRINYGTDTGKKQSEYCKYCIFDLYMIKYRLPYRKTVQLNKMRLGDVGLTILFYMLIQPVITFINALSLVF